MALLSLRGVGKDYAKIRPRGGRLRLVWDLLRGHGTREYFRALDDVSFTMQRGESIGVIGENGALAKWSHALGSGWDAEDSGAEPPFREIDGSFLDLIGEFIAYIGSDIEDPSRRKNAFYR